MSALRRGTMIGSWVLRGVHIPHLCLMDYLSDLVFFPLIAMYKGGFPMLLDTHQNCSNHGLLTDLIYPNFVTAEDRSMLNFIFFAL